MIACEDFRRAALALAEAEESAHMGHPDFRVGGKIFATLWPDRNHGVVMLAPEQQEMLMSARPGAFSPAAGAWGRNGSTIVHFERVDPEDVAAALAMAWRRRAPRRLLPKDD